MILSEHAKQAMLDDDISESEVRECLEHGKLSTQGAIKGEPRFVRTYELKGRKVVVVSTLDCDEVRVITVYAIWSKKWRN